MSKLLEIGSEATFKDLWNLELWQPKNFDLDEFEHHMGYKFKN